MNMFVRFDEIPLMVLQDIQENKIFWGFFSHASELYNHKTTEPGHTILILNAFTYSHSINIQFLPDNPPTLEIFLNHFNNSSSF